MKSPWEVNEVVAHNNGSVLLVPYTTPSPMKGWEVTALSKRMKVGRQSRSAARNEVKTDFGFSGRQVHGITHSFLAMAIMDLYALPLLDAHDSPQT